MPASAMLPERSAVSIPPSDAGLIDSRYRLKLWPAVRPRRWSFEHLCALLREPESSVW